MGERGWFKIDGRQDGDRTLEEQLLGLEPALRAARGRSVLDLGCAEGLIAFEMHKAGAHTVHGVDNNLELIRVARELMKDTPIKVWRCDLNRRLPDQCLSSYDVTLALAIIHKLTRPTAGLQRLAAITNVHFAIRLPEGSTGTFTSKHGDHHVPPRFEECDVNATMHASGFMLKCVLPGPRNELVQHWIRK